MSETIPENFDLAEIANQVFINLNRVNDGSVSYTNLLNDIKSKVRLRWYEIWDDRLWPELIMVGVTQTAKAGETEIGMPLTLSLITRVCAGSIELEPMDPSKDRQSSYDYINRGQNGILLRAAFAADTELTYEGKECFAGLPSDSSRPCIPCQSQLIDIVTADFLMIDETDHARAADYVVSANVKFQKLVKKYEVQMANNKRVWPVNPHTNLRGFRGGFPRNTSRVYS